MGDRYWKSRIASLHKQILNDAYKDAAKIEREYKKATAQVQKDLELWYKRLADNNNISLAEARKLLSKDELEEFKWTVEDYIKYGEANAINQKWLKKLENASAKVHISRLEAMKLQLEQQATRLATFTEHITTETTAKTLKESYQRIAFEIQRGIGVGQAIHEITDDDAVKRVLSKPWSTDGKTFSSRIWTNQASLVNKVETELTQMLIRGDAPDKAIASITKEFDVARRKAGRLVMTESAAFASMGEVESYKEMGVEKYEYMATLDKETCSTCRAMDGKVLSVSQFEIGVTAPPLHPWCRCTTVAYYADLEGIGERAARNEDDDTYYVPADTKYSDWVKAFVGNENDIRGFMPLRGFAFGGRKSIYHILTDDEITELHKDIETIKADAKMFRFNKGGRTGYSEKHNIINVRGDVLPDYSGGTKGLARETMSSRAVMAHEYYGHYLLRPSRFDRGTWQDEFRASYRAALDAPGLTDKERADLMSDAVDRLREAGVKFKYTKVMKEVLKNGLSIRD